MTVHVKEWLAALAAVYGAQHRMWARHVDRLQPWLDDPLPGDEPLSWRHTATGWHLQGSVVPDER